MSARDRPRARTRLRWRAAAVALGAAALALVAADRTFPLPPAARGDAGGTLFVVAEDGTPLRAWPGADGAVRRPVSLGEVSPLYLQALLTYEDRWYRLHPGVNPVALARAGWQWLRHGRIVSGGSTLTMQVARLLEPAIAGRSVGAKLRQIARALQLEVHLSKDEILALYLNHAPMGGVVEGVEAGARVWLGKGAFDLSPAEAALLVALPQSPSRLRPDRAAPAAQAARDKVLRRMAALGVWPPEQVADARVETVIAPGPRERWLAPLAAERLRRQAQRAAAGRPLPQMLRSTIDADVQTRLERLLADRLHALPDAVSIAALVVDNGTLAIRGYAGSADFGDARRAGQLDMASAVRSPGSTLKPFLYALALDDGLVHSESLLVDAPQSFGGYAPGNFMASFSGPVSVSEALQRSLNVPAVDLLERLGPERLAGALRDAGLTLRMPDGAAPNLSLVLGGAGTTLEELVGAYTALARGGVAGRPRLAPDEPLVETRLASAGAAFIVRDILARGGGGDHGSAPDAPAPGVALKTGTSFGFRDAWAVAVTDRYTVGVWVGRPDGTPNPGFFGANTAAPLARELLAALGPTATRPRVVPPGVARTEICWPLGLAAARTPAGSCRVRRTAWTLDGSTPPTLPDRIRPDGLVETAWVDARGRHRLRPGCPADGSWRPVETVRWPTLLEPWVDPGWRSAADRLPLAPPCGGARPLRALKLDGIAPGSTIRAVPGERAATVGVAAIGARDGVSWLLDGRLVASGPERVTLRLVERGEHALTAIDGQGRYDRVSFTLLTP